MSYVIGTKEEVEKLVELDNADNGLPVRGVHVGGGIHVPITETPEEGKGWTMRRYPVLENPSKKEECAVTIDDVFMAVTEKKLEKAEKDLVAKKVETLPAAFTAAADLLVEAELEEPKVEEVATELEGG